MYIKLIIFYILCILTIILFCILISPCMISGTSIITATFNALASTITNFCPHHSSYQFHNIMATVLILLVLVVFP